MPIKIDNLSQRQPLPAKLTETINRVVDSTPREHLRGLERIRLVDTISDPRLRAGQTAKLPGLYHPRQGTQPAWLEVALDVLMPPSTPFYKKWMSRLSLKTNLAAVLFSLIGQHYHLTLRHSVKKGQFEQSVRAYTEKQLKKWNENEHTFRARLFKPLQPTLERWARSLQKRAKEQKRGR
ncbi:MAG TPA: hypothetical protein VG148_03880 [Pyrinomonadaceae bacterium]|nr:hypothetical protein [Pyrinomonadaceae bacterium]